MGKGRAHQCLSNHLRCLLLLRGCARGLHSIEHHIGSHLCFHYLSSLGLTQGSNWFVVEDVEAFSL